MDRTQLAARVLGELAAARTAITVSYMRLWRPAEGTLGDTTAASQPQDAQDDREIGADEHPPRDAHG